MMRHRDLLTATILLFMACSGTESYAATVNGFGNGGFETAGTSTPAEAWRAAAQGYTISNDARSGAFSAQLMSPQTNSAVMLQNSVDDAMMPSLTPGDTPMLSFWAKGFAGTTGNVLFALRYLDSNGAIVFDSGIQEFHNSINTATWTEITYSGGVVPMNAESAFIEFSHAIGPIDNATTFGGTVLVDDVFLGVALAVPEPGSCAALAFGCLALLTRRTRR